MASVMWHCGVREPIMFYIMNTHQLGRTCHFSKKIMQQEGITEEVKSRDQIEWVGQAKTVKSSRIGKDVGYKALQKYYERSKGALKQDGTLDRLRQTVRDAMSPNNTRNEFRQLLKVENIDAIFRINPVGRIYGVTFIDHNDGIVANGSVLGKEFSANVFNELYPAPKQAQQVAEQHVEQKHEVQNHAANPISGIVDTVLDLADTRAYEEQQRQMQQRRKKRRHRS